MPNVVPQKAPVRAVAPVAKPVAVAAVKPVAAVTAVAATTGAGATGKRFGGGRDKSVRKKNEVGATLHFMDRVLLMKLSLDKITNGVKEWGRTELADAASMATEALGELAKVFEKLSGEGFKPPRARTRLAPIAPNSQVYISERFMEMYGRMHEGLSSKTIFAIASVQPTDSAIACEIRAKGQKSIFLGFIPRKDVANEPFPEAAPEAAAAE